MVFTIKMENDKSLIITCKTNIYQKENLVDKIQILCPQFYEGIDLSKFTAVIKYVDPVNVPHTEVLNKDDELYKNRLRYTFPIDSEITKLSGNITLRITFTYVDLSEKKQYVLHTGETTLTVLPLTDYYSFIPEESLEVIDQMIGSLDAKIESVKKLAETYDLKKADNITYEKNKLQLTSNGDKIGNAISIIGGGDHEGDTEFEVVEF